jgi:hypothetical protein
MFIVGFVIFGIYLYLMIWNIFYSSKKQREENYPNLDGMGNVVDYDGIGNQGRFVIEPQKKKRKRKIKK